MDRKEKFNVIDTALHNAYEELDHRTDLQEKGYYTPEEFIKNVSPFVDMIFKLTAIEFLEGMTDDQTENGSFAGGLESIAYQLKDLKHRL